MMCAGLFPALSDMLSSLEAFQDRAPFRLIDMSAQAILPRAACKGGKGFMGVFLIRLQAIDDVEQPIYSY